MQHVVCYQQLAFINFMSSVPENTTKEQQGSYRSIFKATTLFGGVQVYQILISIVKSKFVAVLLGPLGVGIQGLYSSALDLVQTITKMGLSQSAVRDISEANGSGKRERVNLVISVLRKLVWITGLIGMTVVLLFSPVLSKTTFGDQNHIIAFIILSVTLLLGQLNDGQLVVLQGLRRLKDLAKASAIGATFGLFISVPLFYFWGVDGIVPSLVISAFTTFALSWYFAHKVKIEKVSIGIKQALHEGRGMLGMGIAMSVSNILITLCAYVLRGVIRSYDGAEMVGLYTAGFTIITTYFSMIFTALATDYYPRLAAVNKNNVECRRLSNEQGEVASLIMTPLVLICIVFMPLILWILYSDKFLAANDFIFWAVLGMMFKLASWVIAFQFIAKKETKIFIINESLLNTYTLGLSLLGYKVEGLVGLGIAFTTSNFLYLVQVYFISRYKYGYSFTTSFKKLYIIQYILIIIAATITISFSKTTTYVLGSLIIFLSCVFSLRELDKRMGILQIIKKGKNN